MIIFTAGDIGQNVAEMEHEFSYDLLGNDLEGKFYHIQLQSFHGQHFESMKMIEQFNLIRNILILRV